MPTKSPKPEILLRSLLHQAGYRFHVRRKDLPGNPNIVFPGLRKVIFVHGCSWHSHSDCREGRLFGMRQVNWPSKVEFDLQRDADTIEQLHAAGWQALTVWECEINDVSILQQRTRQYLTEYAFVE